VITSEKQAVDRIFAARVVGVCVAEVLGLAGYSLVPALLSQFIETWSLTSAQGGWLAGIMFAGYMLAVVPLVSLTDLVPARTVYLVSSLLSTLSCFALALSDDFGFALGYRALAGIALAGMYMPGLRALTDGIDGPRRARVAAFYTSSFTIGASLSFLLGKFAVLWDWRGAFAAAGVAGALGLLIGWTALPRHTPVAILSRQPLGFRFRAVFRNRDAVALAIGYAAVIWGAAGLRQWIVVFLAFCAGDTIAAAMPEWTLLATAALIGLLGVPAGLLGNELAIRFDLRMTAMSVFLASALATGLFGYVGTLPFTAALLLSLAAGFVVQGNFSNLTSGLLAAAAPQHTGATMAFYSAIGFGGGFLGTWLFGIALGWFGGPKVLDAWLLAFATTGLAGLTGAAALIFVRDRR
jgi:predicted MFS family arabinose efflux permease